MSAPEIINPPGGGGTVTGTGTPGKLAKFTGTGTSIGNSLLSESGTTITSAATAEAFGSAQTWTVGAPNSQALIVKSNAGPESTLVLDTISRGVGIGGSAGTLLHVQDNAGFPFAGSTYDGVRLQRSTEALFSASDYTRSFRAGLTGSTAVVGTSTAHDLLLQRGNVTALTLGASGAVAFAGNLTSSAAQTWTLAAGSTSALNIQSGLLNLDTANSRVGIGTASPGFRLDVVGAPSATAARLQVSNSNTAPALNAEPGLNLKNTTNANGVYTSITNRDSVDNPNTQINFINVNQTGSGAINFVTRDSATGFAERVRIDSTGALTVRTVANPNSYTIVAQDNIAIYTGTDATGTTSLRLGSSTSLPQGCAAVKGTKTAAGGSGTMTFQTTLGGTLGDRMTIDATGNLLMAGGGSAAAPIIANSTGVSGMYFPSAQTAAIVANGAVAATFSKVAGAGVALGGTTGLVFDASGTNQGLKLAAAPGNADAQTLDCYQENPLATTAGNGWTPTLSAGAFWGGVLPVVDYARYVRVGSIIFVHVQLSGAALTVSAFGGATISLPTGIAINTYANQAVVTTNTNNGASGTGVAGAGNIYSPAFAACTRATFQFFYFTN